MREQQRKLYPRTHHSSKPKCVGTVMRKMVFRYIAVAIIVFVGILIIGASAQTIWTTFEFRTTGHAFTTEEVQTRLFTLLNQDRSTYAVSPVQLDRESSNRSYFRAIDVRDYKMEEDRSYTKEDIFIVPESEFGRSYYYSPEYIVDNWRNTDMRFRLNELNRDNTRVGIGVAQGEGNFYVVIRWE